MVKVTIIKKRDDQAPRKPAPIKPAPAIVKPAPAIVKPAPAIVTPVPVKPASVRIYILCHNEQRFSQAKTAFANYYWAVPIRMKYQDITFENAFWKQLDEIKAEWASCKMVGTLSSIAYKKINLKEVDRIINTASMWSTGYYNFINPDKPIVNDHPHILSIINDVCTTMKITPPTSAYCNYWMCTPILMVGFIKWFEERLRPTVMAHPLSLTDAGYKGRMTKSDLTKYWGRPYYPHAPFVFERLNKAFFTKKLYTTNSQSIHYYLFYYKEDISRFTHPCITPIRLSEEIPEFFESRGFLQIDIDTIPNVDFIGFLTPSFFKKTKIESLDDIFQLELKKNTICGFYFTEKKYICLSEAEKNHGPVFIKLWNHILTEIGAATFIGKDFICSYSNMWVADRQNVIQYILLIRKVIHSINSATDEWKALLNSDSKYAGSLLHRGLIKDIIGFPHYTFHSFLCERIIGLFAALHNYKYIDYKDRVEQNNSVKVPRVLCIMACHTNSALKLNAVINNIPFLKQICEKIILVDSDEFIANKHHINSRYSDVDIYYIPNDVLACFSKYIYALKHVNIQHYDKIILCNDSFVIIQPLNKFREKMLLDVDVTTLLASNEVKYHYTDFLRCYNNTSIGVIYNYYLKNASRIKSFNDLINIYEIESTRLFERRNVVFDAEESYKGNINFDDTKLHQYISDGYPIIKCKKLMMVKYTSNKLPIDFDAEIYKLLNPDLTHLTNTQLNDHFQHCGYSEGRYYKLEQNITSPDYISKALDHIKFNPNRLFS
jgi:hypothetical protein